MENKGYTRLLSIIAWLILMLISCWATSESLYMLQPHMFKGWTKAVFWAVSIIFYALSSLGTKWIVDSCNKYVYIEHSGLKFALGIIFLLFFWVGFSVPTNTHTFFYKATIKDVLIQDLADTKTYLRDVAYDQTAKRIIEADKSKFIADVDGAFNRFKTEIMREEKPGEGPLAKADKVALENVLGNSTILKERNIRDRKKLCDEYAKDVERNKLIRINQKYNPPMAAIASNKNMKEIKLNIKYLDNVENKIKAQPDNGEPSGTTANVLTQSYRYIANYFKNLKTVFTNDNVIGLNDRDLNEINNVIRQYDTNDTQTKKMLNVFDVWRGLLAGDPLFKGRGLWFWVIVSLMIDVAGFVFFDIAFRERNY